MQTSIVPLNFCPRFCAALFMTFLCALQLGAAVGQDWERHNSSGVYAIHKGDYVYIGNQYLQRVFRTSGHILRTVALINKLSKAAPNYRESDEFEIEAAGKLQGELTAADFRLEDIAVSERPHETLRTVFTLRFSPETCIWGWNIPAQKTAIRGCGSSQGDPPWRWLGDNR